MGTGSSLKPHQMVANLSQERRHGHQIYTGSLNLTLRHYQGKRPFFQLLQDRLCSASHAVNHSTVLIWDRICQDRTCNTYSLVNCFCVKAGIWNSLKVSALKFLLLTPLLTCENDFVFWFRGKHSESVRSSAGMNWQSSVISTGVCPSDFFYDSKWWKCCCPCIQLQICSQIYWEISASWAQVGLQHISMSIAGTRNAQMATQVEVSSAVPECHPLKAEGHRPEKGNLNASRGVCHYMACI